jgi:hypothetical protein
MDISYCTLEEARKSVMTVPDMCNVKPGDFDPKPNWRSMYEEWRKRCQLAEVFIDQLYEQSHDDNLDWLIAEYKNERTKQFG